MSGTRRLSLGTGLSHGFGYFNRLTDLNKQYFNSSLQLHRSLWTLFHYPADETSPLSIDTVFFLSARSSPLTSTLLPHISRNIAYEILRDVYEICQDSKFCHISQITLLCRLKKTQDHSRCPILIQSPIVRMDIFS